MRTLLLLLIAFTLIISQTTTHVVTLTWTDSLNPTGTTYNVYRATGLCSGTLTFTQIVSGVAVKTYDDNGIAPGNYCYQVTAFLGGVESDPSTQAFAKVKPFPPGQTTAK